MRDPGCRRLRGDRRFSRSLVAVLALGTGCGGDRAGTARLEPGAQAPPGATLVTAELLARGEAVYEESCAECHGPGGRGDGPSASQLPTRPRDQTQRHYMDGLSDREIAETVVYGGGIRGYPSMPASPHLSGEDLVAVVAWVRGLSRDRVDYVEIRPEEAI